MDFDSCQRREISSDNEEHFFPKLFLHKSIYFLYMLYIYNIKYYFVIYNIYV